MYVHVDLKNLVGGGILSTTAHLYVHRTWDVFTYGISKVVLHCRDLSEASRWTDLLKRTSSETTLVTLTRTDGSAFLYVGIQEGATHKHTIYRTLPLHMYVKSYCIYEKVVGTILEEVGRSASDVLDLNHIFTSDWLPKILPQMRGERLRVAHNLQILKSLSTPPAERRPITTYFGMDHVYAYDDRSSSYYSLSYINRMILDAHWDQLDLLIETCHVDPTFKSPRPS